MKLTIFRTDRQPAPDFRTKASLFRLNTPFFLSPNPTMSVRPMAGTRNHLSLIPLLSTSCDILSELQRAMTQSRICSPDSAQDAWPANYLLVVRLRLGTATRSFSDGWLTAPASGHHLLLVADLLANQTFGLLPKTLRYFFISVCGDARFSEIKCEKLW